MATFTWAAGTSADWNVAGDWTLTSGKGTAPPGSASTATDVATLPGTNKAYGVTLGKGDTFDIATLNIAGTSTSHTTSLDITGSLQTNALAYSGHRTDSLINVLAGGLFDIRKTLGATKAETLTVAGTTTGGILELGSADTSGININDADVTFSFNNNASGMNAGEIEFNGPSFTPASTTNQKITNAAWGNKFVFDGANFSGDTFNYAGTTLTVKSGASTILTMNNLSGTSLTSASFVGVGDAIQVVCYAAGTRILTATGERIVESLVQGDTVLTLSGDELAAQPVKWIGRRRIDLTAHPRPETVAPIRIQRGAFADNMPHNDLLVSPDHGIFADGRLICARQLVNGTTIRQEKGWTSVEYFHVELDAHAILLAEGLPAESYLDTGNHGFFANADAPLVLHPDLTDETDYPTREAGSCAPFVWDEASVRSAWQRLAERAAALGQPAPTPETTADPALRIVAKGRTVRPLYGENGLYIFALPKAATEVRLVSRAGAPTDTRPWLEDRRHLGVYVERILLRDASEMREVPLDHPGLSQGWWAVERDGKELRRWTGGDAVLPLPAMARPTMLEIRAGSGGMTYLTGTHQVSLVA